MKYIILIASIAVASLGMSSCSEAVADSDYCKSYAVIVMQNNDGNFADALKSIDTIKIGKDSLMVLYQKANALFGTGESEASFKLLKMLNEKYPRQINVNYLLAYHYLTLEKPDSALYHSNIAFDLKLNNKASKPTAEHYNCEIVAGDIFMEEIRFIRGTAYYRLQNYLEAKNDWLFCLEKKYKPAHVWSALAGAYEGLGQKDSAAYYQEVVDMFY